MAVALAINGAKTGPALRGKIAPGTDGTMALLGTHRRNDCVRQALVGSEELIPLDAARAVIVKDAPYGIDHVSHLHDPRRVARELECLEQRPDHLFFLKRARVITIPILIPRFLVLTNVGNFQTYPAVELPLKICRKARKLMPLDIARAVRVPLQPPFIVSRCCVQRRRVDRQLGLKGLDHLLARELSVSVKVNRVEPALGIFADVGNLLY
mmetsp:Transcript_34880/g.69621  ORF Transcript_34880/g.69621 Transcript_34880/m.69621 type:complete len:211 (-) Transcript_34880:329-961(-)